MKTILKLIIFAALLLTPTTVNAKPVEDIAEDLLATPQENEIVLQTEDDTLFDEKQTKKHSQSSTARTTSKNELTDNNDDDESIMDNTELNFEIFQMFDKDNDNKVDEDTLPGKIIHSNIVRTDIQSFLLKNDLSFEYKKGPLHKIQVYAGYRGSINALFTPSYSTEYENLKTEVGVYGSFKNPNYKFKVNVNPVYRHGNNFIDGFMGDAYIVNTQIPNHQIVAGYSRVQTGVEGGASTFVLPFVARSQIARNFGNSRSLSVKIIGNYNYIDYNLAFGSSGRDITSGFPGAEFNSWVNIKPFGSHDSKYGKLTIGGGFNGGHNIINYGVGSVYVGYKHKTCGYAATVGWKFNPHLQLIGRIDQFDPNRDVSNDLKREYTVGLNWFIKGQALKMVLNYVFCQNQNTDDSHKIILATHILL